MDLNSYIPIKTPRLLFDAFYPEDWKSYYAIEQTPEDHRFNSEELNPRNEEEIKNLYLSKVNKITTIIHQEKFLRSVTIMK